MKHLSVALLLTSLLALSACSQPSSTAGSSVSNVAMNGQAESSSLPSFAEVQAKAQKGNAEAMFQLGAMYHDGDGVGKDLGKAVEWFTKAAQAGVNRAQFNLGTMYMQGDGVPRDTATGVQWLTRAAANNNARANLEMGILSYTGQYVPQDFAKARMYFENAAGRGLGDGANNLAVMNVRGEGGPPNLPEAYAWFDLAHIEGYAQASVSLNTLAGQMTSDQIAQGKKRSAELQSKISAAARQVQVGQ